MRKRHQLPPLQPPPLPGEVTQRIFEFEPIVSEGLDVAAAVYNGHSSPISVPKNYSELATYTPCLTTVPQAEHKITYKIAERLYAMWPREYAEKAVGYRNTLSRGLAGNWIYRRASYRVSPLTTLEQEVILGAVDRYIDHSEVLQTLIESYNDKDTIKIVRQNVRARMLGVAADLAAMPRVMAGIDYAEERAAILRQGNRRPTAAEALVSYETICALPWRMPCKDVAPMISARKIGLKPFRYSFEHYGRILKKVVELDPERLSIPVAEVKPCELRSPFRSNTPEVALDAIRRYQQDGKAVLDNVFSGVTLEAVSVERSYLNTFSSDPEEARVPLTVTPNERLQGHHKTVIKDILTSAIGHQLIAMVMSDSPARISFSDRYGAYDNSKILSKRAGILIGAVSRIFYELMPDSPNDAVPPRIKFKESPTEIIDSVTEQARPIVAAHIMALCSGDAIQSGSPDNRRTRRLRLALILEHAGSDPNENCSARYFTVAANKAVTCGARRVSIQYLREPVTTRKARALLDMSAEVLEPTSLSDSAASQYLSKKADEGLSFF